jgi:hypothetical protein
MKKKSKNTPKGRLVEIDGVTYLLIDGNLLRYADLTFDKGFKIVLGCIGSEEILRHLLNRLLGTSIVHLEYRNTEHPGMTEEERISRFDVYCEDEIGRFCCKEDFNRSGATERSISVAPLWLSSGYINQA